MKLWESVSKTALLGTDRTPLRTAIQVQLEAFGLDCSQEAALQVLEASALLAPMRKAGLAMEIYDETIELIPIEINSNCSAKSSQHLSTILRFAYDDVLIEFLYHLKKNKKYLPAEFLPELLDKSLRSPELWEKLQGALGSRAKYLIAANEAWANLRLNENVTDWKDANETERIRILQYLRLHQPAEAPALLMDIWDSLKVKPQKAFLKTLAVGLSLADEAFLEKCLDSRRKEVRTSATHYLSYLPQSAFGQRMLERALSHMKLARKIIKRERIELSFPESPDPVAVRDGLSLALQWKKGGSGQGQLFHILSIVPPTLIAEHFDRNPQALLDAYVRSDWSELLVQATVNAVVCFPTDDWTALLLEFWVESQYRTRWNGLKMKELIYVCSDAVFNKIAIKCLKRKTDLLDEKALTNMLLKSPHHQWNDELTILFLSEWITWIKNGQSGYWAGFQYRSILKMIGHRTNPNLYDTIKKTIPAESLVWTDDFQRFMKTLAFRKKMIAELETNPVGTL